MNWMTEFRAAMRDEITPAAGRLLDAILGCAELRDSANNEWAAPKDEVLSALEMAKGQQLNAAALRQRLQTIRNAIDSVEALKVDGEPAVTVKSEKHAFVVKWREGAQDYIQRGKTRAAVGDSGHADYQISVGAAKPIAAELQPPAPHYVFLSHNWESDNVNRILDEFGELLGNKLRKLPARWARRFAVDLIYDRGGGFHSRASFEDQIDELCSKSSYGIFMTSDGWCRSMLCQQEASHFRSKKTVGNQTAYICVQFLGNRDDLPHDYDSLPILPSSRGKDFPGCKNLLEVWDRSESVKDNFVSAIRDEICAFLENVDPPETDPGSARSRKHLQKVRDQLASHVHFSPDTASAHRIETHFSVEDGDDNQAQRGERPLAVETLYQWAIDDNAPNRIVFLLGGFGMGKTTTVQSLHEALQANVSKNPNVPTPIYLDFRRLIPMTEHGRALTSDMGTLIHTALHSDARREVSGNQVVDLIRHDRSLVIFDGLDEVGNRIGREAAAQLFRGFLELIPPDVRAREASEGRVDWADCKTRLIVTCRTHFFRSLREQTHLLSGSSRAATILRGNSKEHQVPGAMTFYMAPLRMEQIEELFENSLGEDLGRETFQRISQVHDLPGLASRPIMARFISEVAGQLVERHNQGDPINIATIYEELFLRGLERDAEKRPLLSVSDRRDILMALAVQLQANALGPQTADDLERWFDEFAPTHSGIALLMGSGAVNTRDILHTELENASFLVRGSDDRFTFAHTSYFEYFLALAIAGCNDMVALKRTTSHPISKETRGFVRAVGIRDRTEPILMARWLEILRSDGEPELRHFALDMLREDAPGFRMPEGANLSGMDLKHAMTGGKFRWAKVNLNRAQLNHLDARDGLFRGCNFEGAVLANARLENVQFESCEGIPIGLGSARGVGTELLPEWRVSTKGLNKHWRDEGSYRGKRIVLRCPVSAAQFSPDGGRIVTASDDNTARLWDAETGSLIHTLEGHGSIVLSAEFSPDGARIVT
ncbi:MAG: NACHT domain-containing protein, partial [bacterium]|nr:NACHT domain-containing protein [bacterium]